MKDEGWAENLTPPHSRYEFQERTGGIPTLTFGYTYAPNPLIDGADALQQISRREEASGPPMIIGNSSAKLTILRNRNLWINTDETPRGATRTPPKIDDHAVGADSDRVETRKYPYGFTTVCPFPGFDPERIDRNAHPLSPIYGRQTLSVRGALAAGAARSGSGNGGISSTSGAPAVLYAQDEASMVSQTLIASRPGSGDGPVGGHIEEGFTYDRHPMLWPSRNPLLKSPVGATDFPVNAPVLIDIIQPHMPELQRILTRVTSVNQDLSGVTVQQSSSEVGALAVGAKFSIHVRTRRDPKKWVAVQLEVLDDDYRDDLDFAGSKSTSESTRNLFTHASSGSARRTGRENAPSSADVTARRAVSPGTSAPSNRTGDTTFAFPIPSGYTLQGEPYFAPPVNIPPIPAGYDAAGTPYYGRQPSVKPFPLGLTNMGTRFYPGDGKVIEGGQRNQLAGFDCDGQPFFVPRGFSIPAPTGFTADGIPFYDVPSLMRNRGIMILPSTFQIVEARPDDDDDDDWEDLLPKLHRENFVVNALQRRRTEAMFVAKLSASLQESQPLLKHTLAQAHNRNMIPTQATHQGKLSERGNLVQVDQMDLLDPDDVPEFLRNGLEFSHLKPSTMRIIIEPGQMEFQSVHAPITKTVALRYRAGRGDHGERDYFLAVEPVDVFSLKSFHLRLQGEGVQEIVLTFHPGAMKSERTEGSLALIDEFGKKMATCHLLAVRQSFFKVHPPSIDLGWVLPERRKEASFKIENVSPISVLVQFSMQSETAQTVAGSASDLAKSATSLPQQREPIKRSPFAVPMQSLRLQPLESKSIVVFFEPKVLGRASDVVEVRGPGGDVAHVEVVGTAGIPIAIYPESEESSSAGCNSLARERTEFIGKFRRRDTNSHVALSEEETHILKSMMSAQSDSESRREAHTLDFGICSSDAGVLVRCLTFMNLGDGPATISLFSHHPSITCPYLVRVAPRMANTIEVAMTIGEGTEAIRGNLRTVIEIVCPEFQSIPLHVKSFIGQAVYFPVWEYVFFKPGRISQRQEISLSLINESQYDVGVSLEGIGSTSSVENSSFTTSMSTSDATPTFVPAFSIVPVTFVFHPKLRGPLMKSVTLRIVKPFRKLVAAAMFMRQMRLIGICIEPYFRRFDEKSDKNGIEFLIKWMSHPKMLIDDYPSDEQRYQLFDITMQTGIIAQARMQNAPDDAFDVVFKTDPYITEVQANSVEESLLGDNFRPTVANNPLAVQNRGNVQRSVRFIASTGFVLDPQYKTLQPGELQKLENYFNSPPDIGRLVTIYGFAAALDESDHSLCSAQVIKRLASGILVLPLLGSDHQVIIDFGKIELTGETMTENHKNLLLCNPHSTTYAWNVKFTSLKSKFNPFEAPIMTGEVTGYETFTVPFKFKCDVSGLYESTCEVYITDTADKFAKPIKVGTVVLRGVAVNTSLSGLPETIDFGAVVVFNTKRKVFHLVNNGTSDLSITALVRPPFTVVPKSFTITSKSQMEIEVLFKPNEARNIQTKMQVFANQRLFLIPLTGLGGSAELVCEKYMDRPVDFGEIREGCIGWCSIYLTNKGTLPLTLKAVTTDTYGLAKLQFVSQTASIPIDISPNASRDADQFEVKKNYWGILRRRYRSYQFLQAISHGSQFTAPMQAAIKPTGGKKKRMGDGLRQMENTRILDWSAMVPIHRPDSISIADATLPKIPELRPFYSYHFRLGYSAAYQAAHEGALYFHYVPVMGEGETTDVPVQTLMKNLSIELTGIVYRPLEIFPHSHDFGNAPAERHLENQLSRANDSSETDSYGVTADRRELGNSYFNLEVVNMSLIAQNLILRSISPEFSTSNRSWFVQAGEKLDIPIEFHPPREQIQYHGDAVFQHKYGTTSVHLTGTGASAELVADELVNFGSLKINTAGQRVLQIHNRGLLEAKFELDIVQTGSEFRFLEGDPFECEGTIPSGGTRSYTLECKCVNIEGSAGAVMVKWRRVAKGILERFSIPLKVQIGYPAFRMQNLEIDFKTTYIDVNKTLDFRLYNEGNASCNWKAESENPCVQLDVTEGSIGAGETVVVRITFAPRDFDTLASAVRFTTDAGNPTLMCYGVVGVPYLRIPHEQRDIDFGIVAVNRTHTRSIQIANTGTKLIEYEIAVLNTLKNGVECRQDEFDSFYAQPAHSVVEPGMSLLVSLSIYPREYDVSYTSTYILRTTDGEQYSGRVTAKGGKAIVKIKPPTMAVGETRSVVAVEPEGSGGTPSGAQRPAAAAKEPPKVPVPNIEVSRYVLQSHLDNLYEVLAGLRTAELDITREEETVPEAPMAPMQTGGQGRRNVNLGVSYGTLTTRTHGRGSIQMNSPDKPPTADASKAGAGGRKDPEIMDGSNIRLESRGRSSGETPPAGAAATAGLTGTSLPPSRHESKPGSVHGSGTVADSKAVRFTDELTQLEKELEIAIGLRDPAASIISGSGNGVNFTVASSESGSGSGTAPGTADGGESKPGSPAKKHAGGLGKYQPGRRRGHRRREAPDDETQPDGSVPQSRGSRGMTPQSGAASTPMSPQDESIARNLSSRGLVPAGLDNAASMVLAEMQVQKSKIESLLSIAQDVTLSSAVALDRVGQIELLDNMNDRVLNNTNNIIKAVKEQLSKEKWVPNREFLQQALRRLQMSTIAIENFKKPTEDEPLEENTFNLGLVRGGDKSASVLLFNIPNEGNIGFEFTIVRNKSECIMPPGAAEEFAEGECPFTVDPTQGTLNPGESVNVSATFQAMAAGTYRQGYSVMSADEPILGFTILARVGNPNLMVSPRSIDFGLIEKGKSASRVFVISNTGGYQDFWRVELQTGKGVSLQADDLPSSPFKLSVMTGETKAGESTPIGIDFMPVDEGDFRGGIKVIWTKEPLYVALTGVGGGSKLEFVYDDAADKAYGGLDFGTVPVGSSVRKRVLLRNIGTVAGTLDITHQSKCVTIEIARNDAGEVILQPGASADLAVTLVPEKSELIKDPIVIAMGSSGVQTIPLKARSGVHDWRIDGKLDFLNMPILDSQSRTLMVVNSGTLELPFEFQLFPDKLKSIVTITAKGDGWAPGRPIRPNQLVVLEATIGSDTQHVVDGKVVVRTKMRGEVVAAEFPFKFRIYVDEVAVDDTSDVAVGRVMVGESVTAVRNVTNFGNTRIKYRARVEGVDGKEGVSWRIKSNMEGFLDANETVAIEAVFESLEGKGDDWQEAKLIIERSADDGTDKWSLLSHLKLVGAAGHPELEIEPADIDFGPTGIDTERSMTVVFRNDGNALLNYEVQTPWDAFDEIMLYPEFSLRGIISAGEVRPVQVRFAPKSKINYSSTILVKTPIGERMFTVHGEGASYQIYRESLPDVLQFGEINIADSKELNLNIENGCTHDIDVSIAVYESEPFDRDNMPPVAKYVSIRPEGFRIHANESDTERTAVSVVARAAATAQLVDDGHISNEFLRSFPLGRVFRYYAKIDVLRGRPEILPVEVQFTCKPLMVLTRFLYAADISPADIVSKLDFGSTHCPPQSIDGGARKRLMLYNANSFKLKYKCEISNAQYSLGSPAGIVNPNSCKEIVVDFKGLELSGDETDIPKSEEYNAVLRVNMFLDALPPLSIPVTGILVDQAPMLDIPGEMDFGTLYRGKKYKMELLLRNPARRPLRWRFYVERQFADIFTVVGKSEDITAAKKSFVVAVSFCPAIAVTYKATAYMESDAGNFTLDLSGTGIQPSIEVEQKSDNFGIVGITAPEFREVTVTNPLDLKLRLRVRSDNKHFTASVSEFELKAGDSRKLQIMFSPSVKARFERGNIAFFNLDDLPDGMDESDDEDDAGSGSGDAGVGAVERRPAHPAKPMSPRKELELLKEIAFEGVGGEFGMRAEGMDVSALGGLGGLDAQGGPGGTPINIITITFQKVNQRQRTRKSFEVENCGDTVLELGVFTTSGEEITSATEGYGINKLCSYRVAPGTVAVQPHGKDKITITVEGLDRGEDSFEFIVRTRTLISPKAIKIHVSANVLSSATDESLRAFARADMNLESLFNVALQEEEKYAIEREIWKVLLPIVRVAPVPPSAELQTVPMIEPVVTRPDIGPYLVRPPAIPAVLPQRAKKWYMNRVSMALEGFKSNEDEMTEESARRQEAIEFLQPLEKKVFLEKKRDV
ncbi:hypothetical protein HK105_202255 [Polyrhizophydium stewartii]|uniref:HYDIN/VesB/CFA65-like Ig-like domain-containing protein n=1 Tax=Polyrhizophydium stewartii TaxID=2732419 RepID=A0ABR4NFL8_9FUNG